MPTSKRSSSGGARSSSRSRSQSGSTRSQSASRSRSAKSSGKTSAKRSTTRSGGRQSSRASGGVADGISNFVEQLTNGVIKPLGIVMLSRERIQETLDEAAARGRVTRSDANELVSELVNRGRQQTDELLSDAERILGRSRGQIESATKRARLSEPMDRIVRTADRARRTIGVGTSFPILAYDDLTARQVEERLKGLTRAELRKVREYELRHANRKSVLAAVERELA